MTLHLVYRSYGGENKKRRPDYYSKTLTLSSFIRASEGIPDVDVIFVNDGPIPAERLALMHSAGRVISMGEQPAGMRASYRFALHLPAGEGWPDDDVVMFIEDDYLFTAESFRALADAVRDLTEASYFALYGERPDYADEADRERMSVPYGWHPHADLSSNGRVWFHLASTASTFAARVGVLRSDLDIFEQCMRPFRRRYLDHETCLIAQGAIPYHGRQLIFGLPGDFEPSVRGVIRALILIRYRILLNRRARRQLQPHLLYCLTPNEATHLEHPVISPDRDWEAIGKEVTDWMAAKSRGGVG